MTCAIAVALLLVRASPIHAQPIVIGATQTDVATAGDGLGTGTVVFETGAGDDMRTWAPILGKVSRFNRTFAYNRLGYGKSGPRPANPDAESVARHLHAVLEQNGAPRPWTLVGHSMGGAYAVTFARLYPRDVGALVLIDGTPPGHIQMLKAEIPGTYNLLKALVGLAGGNIKAEIKAAEDGGTKFARLPPFPDVPIYLLRRTKWERLDTLQFRRRVVEMQKEVAALSPCPTEKAVLMAGHYIHRDQPGVVIDTIRKAVARPHC
ncbi:MAG: alpha/beta hydrolase [Sphingomonadales bacterium]|nr:alpha/beta hydrolase [Sphingomonadales bacterium]